MDVILAGLNVDAEILREYRELLERARPALADGADADREVLAAELTALAERRNLTPETLSAAYARISRDPRPAPELRAAARAEVDRARKSNESIIFGLGHASVAEHAVFNLDVLGVSRLAAEFVERFRLCSYTEKSQRYITLEGDYVTPVEVMGTPLEAEFHALVARQVAFYRRCYGKLAEYFPARHPELAEGRDGRRTLDGWAREDARYGLSLATETQLGLTANARNLERIIQAAAAHPLGEVREYGDRLRRAVGGIAPSLIKYTEPAAHHRLDLPLTRERLRAAAGTATPEPAGTAAACRVVDDAGLDETPVWTALMHEAGGLSAAASRRWAETAGDEEKRTLLAGLVEHLPPWQSLPRAFELAAATFECVVSASCFAQLKRHRMGTLIPQDYDPRLGVTVPASVAAVGEGAALRELADASAAVAARIGALAPPAAAYALTNAHRRRVLFRVSVRELAHFARLRLDAHAQWDIREMAGAMTAAVRPRLPLFGPLLCAKNDLAAACRRLADPGGE